MTNRRVSVEVTGSAAGAVKAFEEVGAAAQEAARVATEAGDKVAAAAVRQADTAAQGAARAAERASAEARAAADAFAEGDTAAYERAAAAAEKAAAQAQAAWERSAAASARATAEASAAEGTDAEEAAARAAAAAKESAAAARVQWESAKTASHDAATLAEEDAGRFGTAMEGAAQKTGGVFQKLGSTLGNWGLPFGESISKMGEKFAEAETGGQKFGTALAGLGKVATVAGIAGFAVVGAESVKMATSFQESMTQLVTGAGESKSAIGLVSDGILSMAAQVGQTPEALAKGLYLIESAGYHGASGLSVLKAAAEGAKVGNADMATVADAVTSTLNAYGLKASDASAVTSQLVATTAAGKMHMQDLAGALSAVLPVAAAAHLNFAQVGGAIATMTGQGMSAQQATQDLAHTIQALQNPNTVAIGEMEQLGLKANDVETSLGKRGLTGTLGMLTEAITSKMGPAGTVILNAFNESQSASQDLQVMLKAMPPSVRHLADEFMSGSLNISQFRKAIPTNDMGMVQQFTAMYAKVHGFNQVLKSGSPAAQTFTAALAKMMGGTTGLNTALLLSGQHADAFAQNVASVADAAKNGKTSVQGWSEVQKDFSFQLEQAKAGAEALGVRLGDVLIPKIQDVIRVVGEVVVWFEKHSAVAEALAGIVGGVLVVAVAAYTVSMISAAAATVAASWPILAIIAAVAAVGVGIYELATHWKQVWGEIKKVADDAWRFLDGIWQGIDGDIRNWWGDVERFFETTWHDIDGALRAAWSAIKAFFESYWPEILGIFTGGIGLIVGLLIQNWTAIWNTVQQVWNEISGFFSTVWSGISSAVQTIWGGLASFLTGAWEGFATVTSTLWGAVAGVFSTVWGGINTAVQGVWNGLASFLTGAWQTFATTAGTAWQTIVKGVTGAWDGLKSGATSLWGDVKGIFTDGVNTIIDIINVFIKALDVIPGVNIKAISHVGTGGGAGAAAGAAAGSATAAGTGKAAGGMKRFESGGVVPVGAGFATNTATAIVGEGGPHPEYVIPTDPKYRQNAHSLLSSLLGHIGMPALKHGGILGDIGSAVGGAFSDVTGAVGGTIGKLAHLAGAALAAAAGPIIDAAEGIAQAALGHTPFPVKQLGEWGVDKIAGAARALLAGLAGSGGGGGGGGVAAGSLPVGAHQQLIAQALGLAGVPDTAGNESAVNQIVTHESGWDPNAINNWDSNAKAGDPSRGLMQTIMTTFEKWRLPTLADNIFDPLSNLVAGIRYAVASYGSLSNVPGVAALAHGGGYVGYDTGGVLRPGATFALNATGADEFVFTPEQVRGLAAVGVGVGAGSASPGAGVTYAPVVNVTGVSDSTVAARIRAELDAHDRQLVRMLQGM